MDPRVIKTQSDYEDALAAIEQLMEASLEMSSAAAEELELRAVLVENYERENFPIDIPTPVEAIEFRMEQAGLTRRDLEPYIGTKGRVSEILSGKRQLTLKMVRALHAGLDIPVDALIQEPQQHRSSVDWSRLPLREMAKRGWIAATAQQLRNDAAGLARAFMSDHGGLESGLVFCRRTLSHRGSAAIDEYALLAWTARVLTLADKIEVAPYDSHAITKSWLAEVAQLSASADGPILAQKSLARRGIALVIVPHLPRTRMDGASILVPGSQPVVGLTIRYDRLDNFWFTLLHELGHVLLHLSEGEGLYVDDLDVEGGDDAEREADAVALDSFIPRSDWRRSRAYRQRTPEAIIELARQRNISPAVVAGRLRHETRNFRAHNQLVGHKQVRSLFPDVDWQE